jgi:hypothetical protein
VRWATGLDAIAVTRPLHSFTATTFSQKFLDLNMQPIDFAWDSNRLHSFTDEKTLWASMQITPFSQRHIKNQGLGKWHKLALFIHWLRSDLFRLLRGAADCPRRAVG